LLIVLVALPNFLWQIHNHFPTLEWLHKTQATDKVVKFPPMEFFLGQILTLTPYSVLLWGTGVLWLLFAGAAREFRFVGVFYPIFLVMMMALHAKDYYLVPAYPVFFAAGAVAWFAWAQRVVWRNTLIGFYALITVVGLIVFFPLSVPVMPPQQWLAYTERLHFKPKESETHAPTPLPQFYADRFGWHELVEQVSAIYNALPPQERAVTGILTGNYGEAGAIDILGAKYGLPDAISGHLTYWLWGPRGYTGEEMIVINGSTLQEMNQSYRSCTVVGTRELPYAMPWEHGSIFLCRGRKTTYQAGWDEMKHYY
jgi:hypothetical protein